MRLWESMAVRADGGHPGTVNERWEHEFTLHSWTCFVASLGVDILN